MQKRAPTPTQDLYNELYRPFYKFWRLTCVTDEGYDQGQDSISKREPLLIALKGLLHENEQRELVLIMDRYPGSWLELALDGKDMFVQFYITIAVKRRMDKQEIINRVYEGSEPKYFAHRWNKEIKYQKARKAKKEAKEGNSSNGESAA